MPEPGRRRLALTLRGRCLLASGLACASGALLLGETDLLRVGALLVALPLVAAVTVLRGGQRLDLHRRTTPPVVPLGGTVQVRLAVTNPGRVPTGALLVEDGRPAALGGVQRAVLAGLGPGETRELDLPAVARRRGRHVVGPLALRLDDPFGIVTAGSDVTATSMALVTPRVRPLPPLLPPGLARAAGTAAVARAGAAAGTDDVMPREHRVGDDLRRVHWRSTARRGELMVRREETGGRPTVTLLVDLREGAHRSAGALDGFEEAVEVAASVGTHLVRSGAAVALALGDGPDVLLERRGGGVRAAEHELLERLALAEPVGRARLRPAPLAGAVVAVLGTLVDEDVRALTGAAAGPGHALLLAPDDGPHLRAASLGLAAGGWRVAALTGADALPTAWAGLVGGSSARPGPADVRPEGVA